MRYPKELSDRELRELEVMADQLMRTGSFNPMEGRMIVLKRAETKDELYSKPGMWRPVTNGETRSAIFSCPGCGDVNSLSRADLKPGWTIAADGAVSPSVDHSWPVRKTDGTVIPSCTFHDYIKLEGWGS